MPAAQQRELRICELNAENLFVSLAYYEGQSLDDLSEDTWKSFALAQLKKKQKPLWQLKALAAAIQDISPDILMLVEVGGEDSLKNFNQLFLSDSYDVHFIETNATRGIDLGFLIKKTVSFTAEAFSHRDTPVEVSTLLGKRSAKFSRDAAELRLSDEVSNLKLILLLTHLKSKISTAEDFQGKDQRTAEAIALASIYEDLRTSHPGTPVIVGGDFNADISSLELELIRRTDLTDFHDIPGTAPEERVSLVYFDYSGKPHTQVLDYLLVSPELKDRVVPEKSFTYRYKGFYGISEGPPETIKQRYQMPSDHFPLVLTILI